MSSSSAIFKMRHGKILSLGTASSFTSNSIAIARFLGDGSVSSEIPFNSQPNNSFNIYPNPTNNILHIDSKNKIENITISDMTGKKMRYFQNIVNNEISMEALQKGIYLLECKTRNGNFNTKIIKTDN
jgi:Secretion system C-terminal sorting domain